MQEVDFDLAERNAAQMVKSETARARLALDPKPDTECVECGEPISEARKRAMPAAVRCVACARNVEMRR